MLFVVLFFYSVVVAVVVIVVVAGTCIVVVVVVFVNLILQQINIAVLSRSVLSGIVCPAEHCSSSTDQIRWCQPSLDSSLLGLPM